MWPGGNDHTSDLCMYVLAWTTVVGVGRPDGVGLGCRLNEPGALDGAIGRFNEGGRNKDMATYVSKRMEER
jgi:hypothetical protein